RAASDHSGYAGRCGARDENGRRAARERHLRDWLFVSGRAERQSAHTNADERRPHGRTTPPRGCGVRRSRQRARRNAALNETASMKALAKLHPAVGLTLTDVKKPDVGHNDVLIRIRKTAICGTDMHIWKWDEWAAKTIPVPMHVGHEYVGEIVDMGEEVRGFAIGDR